VFLKSLIYNIFYRYKFRLHLIIGLLYSEFFFDKLFYFFLRYFDVSPLVEKIYFTTWYDTN